VSAPDRCPDCGCRLAHAAEGPWCVLCFALGPLGPLDPLDVEWSAPTRAGHAESRPRIDYPPRLRMRAWEVRWRRRAAWWRSAIRAGAVRGRAAHTFATRCDRRAGFWSRRLLDLGRAR